jgi:hypothetical protein
MRPKEERSRYVSLSDQTPPCTARMRGVTQQSFHLMIQRLHRPWTSSRAAESCSCRSCLASSCALRF